MNLARSTVSEIVSALLPTGLVSEVGPGQSRGGRRPILLRFEDDAYCILGVEMGASHVGVACTNLRGRTIAWRERSHPVQTDPEGTRALIEELCEACLASRTAEKAPLLGIGVAVPSPVDQDNPDGLLERILPAWKGKAGLAQLSERFGVPFLVDNDANLGALAEQWWGHGRGVADFAYIKLGTGVGSGHVIDGRVYRGASGVAGEIGHLAIDPQGRPCVCGLRGCLTTLIGSQALAERASELLGEYPDSVLHHSEVSAERIEDAALAGDLLATRVVDEAAHHLGVALAGLLNVLNPQMVILGGGLARLGELLLCPVREALQTRTLVASVAASQIRASDLGPQAGEIGAATLILRAALSDSRIFPVAATDAKA